MKKALAIILALTLALGMLAACGAKPAEAAPAAAPAEAAPAAAPAAEPAPAAPAKEAVYPEKSINLILPFAAGGSGDMFARLAGSVLPNYLPNASFVVQSVAGGGGIPGTKALRDAPNDGYNMSYTWNARWILTPFIYPDDVDYTLDDFDFICSMNTQILVIAVRADSPFQTVTELFEYDKEHPGELIYTGGLAGNGGEVCIEWMKYEKGYNFTNVSASGDAEAITFLMNGTIDFLCLNPVSFLDYYKSGEMRFLCLLGTNRNDSIPDVPAISEELPELGECYLGFDSVWVMPKGVDPAIIQTIRDAMWGVYNDETFISLCNKQGMLLQWKEGDQWLAEARHLNEKMSEIIPAVYG